MKSDEVASVFLGLQLDMDGLKSQINKAGEETGNSFGSKFSRTFGNVFRYRVANSIINTMKGMWDYWTNGAEDAYNIQLAAETKLQEVMQTRMKATKEEIQSIKDYASELQSMGITGDEITLQGASQLATYLTSVESLKTLMGAMDNLAVSNGGAFSVSDTTSVANMIGKAIANDSIASLTRVGITFTDAEKAKWEELNTEQEKAAFLADVITENVGNMNAAYAQTSAGKLTQVNNEAGDIKEQIGKIIQEVKVDLLPLVQDGLDFVKNIVDKVKTLKGYFEDFLIGLGIELPTQDIVDDIETIGETAEEAAEKANGELAGFDIFNLLGNGDTMTSTTDDLIDSAESANESLGNISDTLDDMKESGSSAFVELGTQVRKFWDDNVEPLCSNLEEMASSIIEFLQTDFMHCAFVTFAEWLTTALQEILRLAGAAAKTIGDLFDEASQFVDSPVQYFKDLGADFDKLFTSMKAESNLEGLIDNKGVWNPDSIFYNPELGLKNLNDSMEKYYEVTGMTDEQIAQMNAEIAAALAKQNINVSVTLDGQKIATNVVTKINKQGKYSNGSLLR